MSCARLLFSELAVCFMAADMAAAAPDVESTLEWRSSIEGPPEEEPPESETEPPRLRRRPLILDGAAPAVGASLRYTAIGVALSPPRANILGNSNRLIFRTVLFCTLGYQNSSARADVRSASAAATALLPSPPSADPGVRPLTAGSSCMRVRGGDELAIIQLRSEPG